MRLRKVRNFILSQRFAAPLVDRLIRYRIRPPNGLNSDVHVSIALEISEIKQAIQIINKSYKELGYINAEERIFEINKYIAQPDAAVLIAKIDDAVIGTMTVVQRNSMALPLEEMVSIESDLTGVERAGEFTCLVVDPKFRRGRGFQVTFQLMRYAYWFSANRAALDKIFIACQPEHVPFYRALFGFRLIRGRSQVDDYKGTPAAFIVMDVMDAKNHMRGIMSRNFNTRAIADFFFRCPEEFAETQVTTPRPTWSSAKLESLLETGTYGLSQMSEQEKKQIASRYFNAKLTKLLAVENPVKDPRQHRRHPVILDTVAMDAKTQKISFGLVRSISKVAFEFVSQSGIPSQTDLYFKIDFNTSMSSYVRGRILREREYLTNWVYVILLDEVDENWQTTLARWEGEE